MSKILNFNIKKRQILIENALFEEQTIIENIKMNFPNLKLELSKEELIIVNQVILEYFINNFKELEFSLYMNEIMYNSLYDALANDNILTINNIKKYLYLINIENINILQIMNQIDYYLEETKIKQFNKSR